MFLLLERAAEVHVKNSDARPISDEAALIAAREIGHVSSALAVFKYAVASKLPTGTVE